MAHTTLGEDGLHVSGGLLAIPNKGHSIKEWKTNMEPTNPPFRKENHLPNLHDYVPC